MPHNGECTGCSHHVRSREEAGKILREIIAAATLRRTRGGRTVIEAMLNNNQVMTLCLWEVACEECEDTFDREEDRTAPWVE